MHALFYHRKLRFRSLWFVELLENHQRYAELQAGQGRESRVLIVTWDRCILACFVTYRNNITRYIDAVDI